MFLARLRAATSLHHASLDNSPLLSALMTPDLDKAVYSVILERFYGFMRPLEACLYLPDLWAGWGLDMESRRKAALLEQDIVYLGSSHSGLDAIPLCEDLPCTDDLEGRIGTLYVCEGSTLGGRVICKQLEQSLGVGPGRGGSYFSAYGARTGPLWKVLCERIESHASAHVDAQPAIKEAAVQTFQKLERWFNIQGDAGAN